MGGEVVFSCKTCGNLYGRAGSRGDCGVVPVPVPGCPWCAAEALRTLASDIFAVVGADPRREFSARLAALGVTTADAKSRAEARDQIAKIIEGLAAKIRAADRFEGKRERTRERGNPWTFLLVTVDSPGLNIRLEANEHGGPVVG